MTQGMRILRVMAKNCQASRGRIEAIESAAVGSDPKCSGMIVANRADTRIAQAARRVIVDEVIARGVVTAQAAVRPHPNPAAVVRKQGAHRISGQRAGVLVAMSKVANITSLRIEDIQTLVQGAGPDTASSIDEQRAYRVTGERVRFVRVVPERLELLRPP